MPLRPAMRIMGVVNPMLRLLGLCMWFVAETDEHGLTPARVVGFRIGWRPRIGRS